MRTCHEVCWVLDRELRVIAISRAAAGWFGLETERCVGQPIEQLFTKLERAPCASEASSSTSGAGLGLEVRMTLEHLLSSNQVQRSELDRESTSLEVNTLMHLPLLNERGELAFIISQLDDRARTAELEHANAELLREIAEHMKTEKALQRTQEQLSHAQRLEAIGRLAGGIAHDFNNLLSVVLGYSGTIATELPPEHPLQADIEEIRRAGERAAELTRQLLAFGRRQVLEPRVLDLNEVIGRVDR
ncbi:MAG TPA: histidine kinase dimerization/phospho-acceptor domain-containing protein, partial [Polyangiaceae bacterium]|nr:histidine kinase dimerization/phospho-acceptor domain-containing protein [Polyangiaceae bacterium]